VGKRENGREEVGKREWERKRKEKSRCVREGEKRERSWGREKKK